MESGRRNWRRFNAHGISRLRAQIPMAGVGLGGSREVCQRDETRTFLAFLLTLHFHAARRVGLLRRCAVRERCVARMIEIGYVQFSSVVAIHAPSRVARGHLAQGDRAYSGHCEPPRCNTVLFYVRNSAAVYRDSIMSSRSTSPSDSSLPADMATAVRFQGWA
jgi:hypothetical protein